MAAEGVAKYIPSEDQLRKMVVMARGYVSLLSSKITHVLPVGAWVSETLRGMAYASKGFVFSSWDKLSPHLDPRANKGIAVGAALVLVFTFLFGGGKGPKMMKAPGKPGSYIPRPSFEADPKAYFSGLRGR